jgi:hypothetical protein
LTVIVVLSAWGHYWDILFLRGNNCKNLALQVWRVLRKIALARLSINCKLQTRPLVREGAPHKKRTSNCMRLLKNKIGRVSRWVPDTNNIDFDFDQSLRAVAMRSW